ncbi:MAG: nuclear transport factor 2 family protein [Gilvibacter sp.]
MQQEHPNIEILKKFNPADPGSAGQIIAQDFVWHYINPELPELEGDYLGLTGLTDFFKRLAGRTDGSFKVKPLAIVPLGDQLVVTHVRDAMVLNGKNMEVDAIVTWCIIDGKIKEAWDVPALPTAKFVES